MIPSPEAVYFVIDVLNEMGVPYIVTGSIASNAYGDPRSTIDADFVVDVDSEQMRRIRDRLLEKFVPEDQMAFETVTGKVQHKFNFRNPSTKFQIEIFEARMDDPHEIARFQRRKPVTLEGHPTFFPSAEDVVIQKMRWFNQIRRSKDREDVINVMRRQWLTLDWKYVEDWCERLGATEALLELKSESKKIVDSD